MNKTVNKYIVNYIESWTVKEQRACFTPIQCVDKEYNHYYHLCTPCGRKFYNVVVLDSMVSSNYGQQY